MENGKLGQRSTTITIITALDTITERKIENATEGLSPWRLNSLHRMLPTNKENVLTIYDYISSLKSEINPSDCYRKDSISTMIPTIST